MPNILTNTCKLFADDAKVFCNTFNSRLQGDIEELALWSEKWQLLFNVRKCKSLQEKSTDHLHYEWAYVGTGRI